MAFRHLVQQARAYSRGPPKHWIGRPSHQKFPFLRVSDEVKHALINLQPVVALESAVYTHGFPKTHNLELARQMEQAVRDSGAVPATICVMGGKVRVGLNSNQLEEMCDSAGTERAMKISRRDLPYAVGIPTINPGNRIIGGTTVAGTIIAARMAGIQVFATGGIGGVHSGVADHFDISADLTELAKNNITVISSGAKSFLDIPKTLEVLETQGVHVSTFRDKDYAADETVMFPAFYSRSYYDLKAPNVVEDATEAAAIAQASRALRMESGQLFTNPIPKEYEIPHSVMADIIASATEKAHSAGVKGKDITPYILQEIRISTDGKSLRANRAMLLNNARMGGKVASEFVRLRPQFDDFFRGAMRQDDNSSLIIPSSILTGVPDQALSTCSSVTQPSTVLSPVASISVAEPEPQPSPDVVVVGGVAVDLTCDPTAPPKLHTSNPSKISESLGGVASNVARAIHKCGTPTRLVSSVGNDISGQWIRNKLHQEGLPLLPPMDISGISVSSSHSTARYISFTDSKGGLVTAAADMDIHAHQDIKTIRQQLMNSPPPKFVVIDGNLSKATTLDLLKHCHKSGLKVIFEPTSTPKSAHIIPPSSQTPPIYPSPHLFAASPNIHELDSLYTGFSDSSHFSTSHPWFALIDLLGLNTTYRDMLPRISKSVGEDLVSDGTIQKAVMLLPYISKLWIKMGEKGCLVVELVSSAEVEMKEFFNGGVEDVVGGGVEVRHRASERAGERFGVWGVRVAHYPAAEKMGEGEVVGVNGAGDTFLGVLVAGLVRGMEVGEAVMRAQMGSVRTLRSKESVGDLERLFDNSEDDGEDW